ncbi:MAG: hypothetical protein A3H91_02375 [Gammaproteobacteria bacterium RIFCSPLOWO2_02_FULL_61_13]|nr:MAG: hypothetical protein A3H91_02375 [Gammaproteobacteria bacterium RIFCSPLOWO2_02_FULL_61_13]
MPISMFDASVPPISHALKNLSAVLQKGAAHAEARKFDPSVLVNARLFPDMFPLSRQVQIATDQGKGGPARLAGIDPPKFEDNETTFPALIARIDRTVSFIESLRREQIDGSEERKITLVAGGQTLNFLGLPYLTNFVLPNLYFHSTTAYNILRHNGVEIGKMDFLGKI